MNPLRASLEAAVLLLPEGFRQAHARLWHPEHLSRIADRLAEWHANGVPASPPEPWFSAECTPPLAEAFSPFAEAVRDGSLAALARAVEAAGCGALLVLLGQRRTPASLTDASGIPPTTEELLASAAKPHHPDEELTVGARALAKHAHRSPDLFWGKPSGPAAAQNQAAAAVLEKVLAGRTWWNVFGHFQHETVFEARLPTGHGARWGAGGGAFIGFLEPFAAELCPSLQQ